MIHKQTLSDTLITGHVFLTDPFASLRRNPEAYDFELAETISFHVSEVRQWGKISYGEKPSYDYLAARVRGVTVAILTRPSQVPFLTRSARRNYTDEEVLGKVGNFTPETTSILSEISSRLDDLHVSDYEAWEGGCFGAEAKRLHDISQAPDLTMAEEDEKLTPYFDEIERFKEWIRDPKSESAEEISERHYFECNPSQSGFLLDLVFARLEMIEDRPMDERDDHEEAMLRDILEILNRKEPDPVKPFACEHGSRRAACPICSDEREVV